MTEPKKELKKLKVKEIYFDENGVMPCFELESGEIKKGYFMMTAIPGSPMPVQQLHFYTDNEYANLLAKFEAQKKLYLEKNKSNLVLPNHLRKT